MKYNRSKILVDTIKDYRVSRTLYFHTIISQCKNLFKTVMKSVTANTFKDQAEPMLISILPRTRACAHWNYVEQYERIFFWLEVLIMSQSLIWRETQTQEPCEKRMRRNSQQWMYYPYWNQHGKKKKTFHEEVHQFYSRNNQNFTKCIISYFISLLASFYYDKTYKILLRRRKKMQLQLFTVYEKRNRYWTLIRLRPLTTDLLMMWVGSELLKKW